MSRQEALNLLHNMPEWNDFLSLEKKFCDDEILKLLSIPVTDPNFEKVVSYHKGIVDGIIKFSRLRDTIRLSGDGISKQGGKNADN